MKSFLPTLFAALVLAGTAVAQPTEADMRAAYEIAVNQRNRSEDGQVELAVALRKMSADYEARLATAMEWLKSAQAEKADPPK